MPRRPGMLRRMALETLKERELKEKQKKVPSIKHVLNTKKGIKLIENFPPTKRKER